jgi:excisionase family DNA binding protein
VTVAEAAFVLQVPIAEVRRRIRAGELTAGHVGRSVQIDALGLAEATAERPLARLVLQALLRNSIKAPASAYGATPPPLTTVIDQLGGGGEPGSARTRHLPT